MKAGKKIFLIYLIVYTSSNIAFADDRIDRINEELEKNNASWRAGESWVTRLSPEERKQIFGEILEPPDPEYAKLIAISVPDSLPSHFDWRDNDGNWVTPVRYQGLCGSCWAFSATAQVESWWKISNNNLDTTIDISEQFIISCGDAGDCNGGLAYKALDFYRTNGVPSESCLNYYGSDDIPCEYACSNWRDEAVIIPGWGFITLEEDIIDNIKAAVYRHPVSASFQVYSDFDTYRSGIYEHTPLPDEGSTGHAILIVGWDDEEECWICKNSWSEYWGENGYFRIRWHNCGMGTFMPFIFDELVEGSSLSASPFEGLEFNLRVGDSTGKSITVKNIGTGNLEFSSIDYQATVAWHPDTLKAYDGMSWWCGTHEYGGYNDNWLQYLETPVIDLSNTTSPILSWMGNWSIASTGGIVYPYDGGDGCNVWISIDGGKIFNVANPGSPDYNCQSLFGFGDPDQGWGMGSGIPGWTSYSGGWIPVEFDLASYISDSVIIRWAFASDNGFCTLTHPIAFGLMVDNIIVSDNGATVFEDYADDMNSMNRLGFASDPASWIDIFSGGGLLLPGDSTEVTIMVKTRDLEPGEYYANITFTSNDTTQISPVIPITLHLQLPDHDVCVDNVWLPEKNLCVISEIPLGAIIRNCGLNDETNFNVIYSVYESGNEIYRDSCVFDSLASGAVDIARFDPLFVTKVGKLNVHIETILENDYNGYNNNFNDSITITNTVDDFELESGLWIYEGGAERTSLRPGHSGQYTCSMGGSATPYRNSMDSKAVYKPGFDLSMIDYATLKFRSLFQTERNKDICYIEASTDSISWIKLDSLSGILPDWTRYDIELTNFINNGFKKVWIRFHFVSDDAITSVGLFIDDVEIFTENPVEVADRDIINPTEYKLEQNFPNPFNPTTTISYSLPLNCHVTITIYDISGREIITLRKENETAGYRSITWDGQDKNGSIVHSGVYIYNILTDKYRASKKMLFLK